MKRYVGIDPSTKTGLSILYNKNSKFYDEHTEGLVAEITTKKTTDIERFEDIATQILSYLEPDDVICIEGFSYGSKGQGVSTQYGIGWIIRYMLYNEGFEVIEVPPTSVKKFATGKGNVKKDNMVLPIYKLWGFESNSDNIRDAYVLSKMAEAIHEVSQLTKYQIEVLKKSYDESDDKHAGKDN
ncbi:MULTISPECIES: crossover junction endodeoxyribonuclease RuvC [Peribacillus]|uniref:crossover junction endodeoxyribonuclease RuvC n=1 Tax=Peribacillus TaxID=2675229 RepID=UPI001F4E739C|nr:MULTISPECIES: crossover junction endodeoxyribonuclease RuvC [unclassified Peribacillus]MCK1982212.1 crossover junction endodeoxyribonuclease RuvC [Peribacillus sp. Aquil_B1]MCK2007436.1 crossover junction endodeoxyribonuclease RuvC [Peribacillus sp. Aquil_B8]